MGFSKKLKDIVTAPKASVELKLGAGYFGDWDVTIGQSIHGNIHVSPEQDFDATEVRFEIQCNEHATVRCVDSHVIPYESKEEKILFEAKTPIFGPTHFTSGEVRDFPLTLSISPTAQPSYVEPRKSVFWTIKGVVKVLHRPAATLDQLIHSFRCYNRPLLNHNSNLT